MINFPFCYRRALIGSDDGNNITESGFYGAFWEAGLSNIPDYSALIVFNAGSVIIQFAIRDSGNWFKIRTKNWEGWSEWINIM